MTKRIQAKYKISRRLGVNLWGRAKDPFEIKNYPPGLHGGQGKRKILSDYGKQLAAKQQLKGYYGNITEKQFRRIFKDASRIKGDTSENLIGLLESRLDAILFRANLVPTVFSSRQLVAHKHVTVNGHTVNIPSYRLKVGDVVQIKEKSREIPMVIQAVQAQEAEIPDYIEVNDKEFSVKYNRVPKLADVPYAAVMEPNLVIEYYSK